MIWGGRGTKDLVVHVKVNRQPLTDVWDQSHIESASTLFVCFSYARNRSLDRLLSAIHILRNSLLLKTMTEKSMSWGQSRIQRHNINSYKIYKEIGTQFVSTHIFVTILYPKQERVKLHTFFKTISKEVQKKERKNNDKFRWSRYEIWNLFWIIPPTIKECIW